MDAAARDVRAVAEAQERLLRVVEGISEELARISSLVNEAPVRCSPSPSPSTCVGPSTDDATWTSPQLNDSALSTSETLHKLALHEAKLLELQRGQAADSARQHDAVEDLLRELRAGGGVAARLARHDSELADLRRLQQQETVARAPNQQVAAQLARHEAAISVLQNIPAQLQHLQDLQQQIFEVHRLDKDTSSVPEPVFLETQIDRLEAELAEVHRLRKEETSKRQEEMAVQVARLEAEIADVNRQHRENLSKQEIDLSAHLSRLEASVTTVQRLHGEKSSQQEARLAVQLGNVEADVAELQLRHGAAQQQTDVLAELARLQSEMSKLQCNQGTDHSSAAQTEALKRLARVEAQVADMQRLVAEKRLQREDDATSGKLTRLEAELAEEKRLQSDRFLKQRAEVQAQLSQLEREVHEAQRLHVDANLKHEVAQGDMEHLGTQLMRHESELGGIQRLHDAVERHESAIARLQHGQPGALPEGEPAGMPMLLKQLELWQVQLRKEFMAVQQELVVQLVAELRAQLCGLPSAEEQRAPAGEQRTLIDERLWQQASHPREPRPSSGHGRASAGPGAGASRDSEEEGH